MDFTEQSPVILSLCPGIRGIERGLERVFRSVRVAAYVEIETFIVENLLTAMEAGLVDAAPVWTNLKTFNPEPFRNRTDGIIGGYPCQPFSLAGNRGGTEDPRHLFPYIEKSIRTIRPLWCFFENVSGHLSMGYAEVSESLRDMGYRVEAAIFTAEEVGAPHQRERLFILAILGNTGQQSLEGRGIGGRFDQERWGEPNGSINKSGGTSEVANTNDRRSEQYQQDERIFPELGESFAEMANPGNVGLDWWNPTNDTSNDGSGCPENRKGVDSGERGSQTWPNEFFKPEGCGSTGNHDRFPAGQGQFQYDWEEPRTIESSLVYTVNGYNFTEDLHRAIGNSVVEQTAELAFRDLLSKHFPNP